MPLFGKHKKNDGRHGKHDDANLAANDPAAQQGYGAGPGTTNQTGGAYPNQAGVGNTGTGMGADPYANQTAAAGGPGTGVAPGTGANPPVPPAGHINADPNRTGGGAGSRLAGKAERAAGTMVGSQALKERGFQKEQEANAFKTQSAEIAEAERLEKEALMRRERAVAHGAHPDNRHLGGLQNANTLQDVTGDQAGQGMMGSAGGQRY
ncbi:hypothetical protein PYCCODRAFT_1376436 [Trametes coccinea BRFM310]|uniref:Uncharacterized protein n=1 Tax=Trametes coccinea (strain BRFM310) TaxID=1353009 RepID=A0A1Y2I9I0_TRAC3|nr:hypothetical protein PYCCODRAFT_1376436 [Trametes coccinea BRFM310]